jgi:hypothetical protein
MTDPESLNIARSLRAQAHTLRREAVALDSTASFLEHTVAPEWREQVQAIRESFATIAAKFGD